MNYLFLATSVVWVLIAGYVVILGKRQKKLQKEIFQLEEWNSEQ
ncbi:CcmD family protein [Bacillus dakarensis]|nr:CcmD family protein [Bacillus dakarensis]